MRSGLALLRFIAVDDEAVYLLADFDGPLDDVLEGLADHSAILDPVLEQVTTHPRGRWRATEGLRAWARAHCIRAFADYSAYPGATVRQIGSEAAAAGIDLDVASAQQLRLLVIMPMKSRLWSSRSKLRSRC